MFKVSCAWDPKLLGHKYPQNTAVPGLVCAGRQYPHALVMLLFVTKPLTFLTYFLDIWPVSSPDSWLVSPRGQQTGEGPVEPWARQDILQLCTASAEGDLSDCTRHDYNIRICKENDLASILISWIYFAVSQNSGHQKVSGNTIYLTRKWIGFEFRVPICDTPTFFSLLLIWPWFQSSTAVIPSWDPDR